MGSGRGKTKRTMSVRSRLEDLREHNDLDATSIRIVTREPSEDLMNDLDEYLYHHLGYEELQDLGSEDEIIHKSVILWTPKGGYVDADDLVFDIVLDFAKQHTTAIISCEVGGKSCMAPSPPLVHKQRLPVERISF